MNALKCMPGLHALLTDALRRAGHVASGVGMCSSSSHVGCMNTANVFRASCCDASLGPCTAVRPQRQQSKCVGCIGVQEAMESVCKETIWPEMGGMGRTSTAWGVAHRRPPEASSAVLPI